jgi:hypothetical protein
VRELVRAMADALDRLAPAIALSAEENAEAAAHSRSIATEKS